MGKMYSNQEIEIRTNYLNLQVEENKKIIENNNGRIVNIDEQINRLRYVMEALGGYQADIDSQKKNSQNMTEEIGSDREWEGLGKFLVTILFGKICEDWDAINNKRQECYDLIQRKIVEFQSEKAICQRQINDAYNTNLESNREINKLKRES